MAFSFRRSVLKFHDGGVYITLQDDCQGICRFLSFLLLNFDIFGSCKELNVKNSVTVFSHQFLVMLRPAINVGRDKYRWRDPFLQ